MVKIKRFNTSVLGEMLIGRDAEKVVTHFLQKKGYDPKKTLQESTENSRRWMLNVDDEHEMEIFLDQLQTPEEATIYMGINIVTIPVRDTQNFLVSALEIADGLIGVKLGLVGYFLILSAGLGAEKITYDELDYYFRLILAQKDWVKEAILEEFAEEDLDN